jgi:hypothetical protein
MKVGVRKAGTIETPEMLYETNTTFGTSFAISLSYDTDNTSLYLNTW